MTNVLALALIEFCKKDSPPEEEILKKYGLTKKELWSGFAQLMAKAPR